MNPSDLTAAFAGHDPDPGAVKAAFHAKRRRRTRNRYLAASGGLAAAGVVAVMSVLQPWASAPGPAGAGQPAGPPAPSAAGGCAAVSLPETLATAVRRGASVIVADGSLTGKTAAGSATGGEIYYQMLLRSVRTLAGPAVASGSTGWIASGRGPAGLIPGADAGALWGTDGHLFAIAAPAAELGTGTTVGTVLRVAPVTHGSVIFSTAGCWDTSGLPSRPYHGPLAEIPGSGSYQRATPSGFHAVPLSTVEQIASRAARS